MLAHTAYAQGGQVGNERAFVNEYARPGRPTMTIYAWGAVGQSGIWRVERDVGIIEFLSAANVPGLGTDQVETRERYLLRLYREEGSGRQQIYEGQLENVIEETGQVPALQGGDVVVLERQQERRWTFRAISQYIGTASSIVLLLLRLNVI